MLALSYGGSQEERLERTTQIKCFGHPNLALSQPNAENLLLIILDFYIPGADCLQAIQQLQQKYPQTPIVIISSSTSLSDKKHCLDAGATAYFPKHAPPDVTLQSLARFIETGSGDANSQIALQPERKDLTEKQVEILIHLARGYSNKKIAELLCISPETVKTHLANIYRSIGATNRDDAVLWARAEGLL